MNDLSAILMKMEKIRSVFQASKDFASSVNEIDVIADHIQSIELEFRSVAYEGAAMAIALKDLSKKNGLLSWNIFLKKLGAGHEVHIHSGLGWALAQENEPTKEFISDLHPLMKFRVLDGYGYFEGILRQRQAIKNQIHPEHLKGILLRSYDQGVGRSLWYTCKADDSKISETINSFVPTRQQDLWRGIGIAAAYVGGCDEDILDAVLKSSANHRTQLLTGGALAIITRIRSDSPTADMELLCDSWFSTSHEALVADVEKLVPDLNENAYEQWITAIEKQFVSSAVI